MLQDLKVNQHFVQDFNQEKPPYPITRDFINDFFLIGTLNSYKYEKKGMKTSGHLVQMISELLVIRCDVMCIIFAAYKNSNVM